MNKRKAKHYCELAAINGNVYARHNHGSVEVEGDVGNYHRAFKHLYFLQGLGTNYLWIK